MSQRRDRVLGLPIAVQPNTKLTEQTRGGEMIEKYATVDEVIAILQKVSDDGKGDYAVVCNGEYYLAKIGDEPDVYDDVKAIDLGGYR